MFLRRAQNMDNITNNTPEQVSSSSAAGRADERPHTIPALKEWSPGSEAYTFRSQARILLAAASSQQVEMVGDVLADDIEHLTGLRLPVLAASDTQPGDIVLQLDPDEETPGAEGYTLSIAPTCIIRARTGQGLFNGTRTLLQLLRQGTTLRGGVARDWPDYPERSLMVDMGRKYFSARWLENHIRELAYLKYNFFHFHLSDNDGFRLESERHPEIVSPDHYTKEQMRALIELARHYHITIVPEIEMPGHMDTILAAHPDLQLVSVTGRRRPGDIDLSQEASYQLLQDLLEEYLPLFPGPYWHIGADEYINWEVYENYPQLLTYAQHKYGPGANAKDSYLGFVNWANEIVKSHGKVTRAWNDGLHSGAAVTVASDITVEHWFHAGLTPQELVARDHAIMNCNADYLYYVLHRHEHWRAAPDALYNAFEPQRFHGLGAIDPQHPRLLGAKLHVWCDKPEWETEEQVAEGIRCPLRSLAQKNWGAPALTTAYDTFLPIIERIGRAPGYAT
ncbi:MAG TPA: family 20 glycosylhydrolase [Ktedonobacterales bacterium]